MTLGIWKLLSSHVGPFSKNSNVSVYQMYTKLALETYPYERARVLASPPHLGYSSLANKFSRHYVYMYIRMSQLGYWLCHIASVLRPSRYLSAEDAYQMYIRCIWNLCRMYTRCACLSDVYKATFINLSLWASSVFGFATSPRGFAPREAVRSSLIVN